MLRLLIRSQMKGVNIMTKDQTGETNHSLHPQQGGDGELETLKREVERLRAKDAEVSISSETAEKVMKDDNITTPEKRHRLVLGHYPEVSLSDAREKAAEKLNKLVGSKEAIMLVIGHGAIW